MGFIISGSITTPSYYAGILGISTSGTTMAKIATDSSGNFYACGQVTPSSYYEWYLVKFDSTGTILWQTKVAGQYGYDDARGIKIDASGNIFVTGIVTVASGQSHAGIFKFDNSGTLQWQRTLGHSLGASFGYCVDVDSSGNIYIGGQTWSTLATNRAQVSISKYDASGTFQWQRQLGNSNDDTGATGIKVDSSGSNVYITGQVDNGNSYQIGLVAKYNSSGTIQWQKTIPASANNKTVRPTGLVLDSSDNLYITAGSNSAGAYSAYLFKFDSAGTAQWQRTLTDNTEGRTTTFNDVAIDSSNNVYAVGNYYDKATIVKYNSSGALQWQRTFFNVNESLNAIAVNSNSLCFAGSTSAPGGSKPLFGKLPLDGSRTGSYSIGSYSFAYSASSLTDSAGSLASSTSSMAEAAGLSTSATSTYSTSTPTLAQTLASVGAAGGAIASGMSMGGTGLGMVISSYVAAMSGATTTKAIFGYGTDNTNLFSMTNLVSNTGVVAADTTGVGTARPGRAAAGYGGDKAIFGYGQTTSITNLVSNTGVVATDTTGVGTPRLNLAAAGYGTDKAIFGYGVYAGSTRSITNLVSNTGVVATDTTGVGTNRSDLAAASYGDDKAIFGYGDSGGGSQASMTNKVSNTGVVASDTTGVGTARHNLAAAGYGSDKAIFGYGFGWTGGYSFYAITNKVSNTGVVATDTTGVGTGRQGLAAAGYGTDKAIFGYGATSDVGSSVSVTNLVSNTGVVATNTAGVGTARFQLAAAGYSQS